MVRYQAPKYIADLQFDMFPADPDWKGVENPLTVYDRIDSTEERYGYVDLYDRFDKISLNGKAALGSALFEWVVNRLAKEYGSSNDIEYIYSIITTFWAASVDQRYGGCNIPGFEDELLINISNKNEDSDVIWLPSEWPAKGDVQNLLFSAIVFRAHVEDVVNGPNVWLKRFYYLVLYLMPDNIKPIFQKWFNAALDRLEKYTPNYSTANRYDDLFEEHLLEDRGLPVAPQLFDPEFEYSMEGNTKLVNDLLQTCDYNEILFLNHPDDLIEDGFEDEPYMFRGLVHKERKSVDIQSLVAESENFDLLKNTPSIIKISNKEVDPDFQYDHYWFTDDRDNIAFLENPKLGHVLAEIEGRALLGLTLATSEWILNIVKGSVNREQLENLIESMWAKMDLNYIKPNEVYPFDDDDDEYDDEGYDDSNILKGLYEVLAYTNIGYNRGGISYEDSLQIIALIRMMYKNKDIFDAWLHNVVGRLMKDYPKTEDNREQEEEISNTPIISRDYYFNINSIYDEVSEKEKLENFISHLDYTKNTFLPTPEEVYLMSFVRGKTNENPYNRNLSFSKEVTTEKLNDLGNKLIQIEMDKMGLKCFDLVQKLDATDHYSYACKGYYYYKKKEYELAVKYLYQAIQIEATSESYCYLGACYYSLEDYDKAYESFIKAINLDESAREQEEVKLLSDKLSDEAYAANLGEHFDLCVELATKAITLYPENVNAYLNRAAGYGNMNPEKELSEEEKADLEIVKKLDPQKNALIYANEGFSLVSQGKYEEALKKADMALEIDDKEPHGYYIKGYIYGEMKIFDEACAYMDKAIELDSNYGYSFMNRGYYLRKLGRLDESIESYTQAITKMAEKYITLCYDGRGKTYAASNQFDKALEDWLTAYEYSKTFTEFIYVIFGYASVGNIDKAKELLNQSFTMENDATGGDVLIYAFVQYALQVNTEEVLTQCKNIIDSGKTNQDYPLKELVRIAVENGHPDEKTLKEIAKKINQ